MTETMPPASSEQTAHRPVRSPCVRICRRDEPDGACSGCLRTAAEIIEWFSLSEERKAVIVADIPRRMRARLARRRAERASDPGETPAP